MLLLLLCCRWQLLHFLQRCCQLICQLLPCVDDSPESSKRAWLLPAVRIIICLQDKGRSRSMN
jgi:hypothetical protein